MNTLELEPEQFIMVLTKKMCDQLVFILDLFPEEMLKEPETMLEQNDQLMRKLDKAKFLAFDRVAEECKSLINSINELDKEIEKSKNIKKEFDRMMNEAEKEELNQNSENSLLTEEQMQAEAAKQMNSSNKFTRKEPNKKKFRW